MTVHIIGIAGPAGSGKDTLASLLMSNDLSRERFSSGTIKAFADPLKEYVKVKFGLTDDDVSTQEGKAATIPWLGVTVRHVLQQEGTELTRGAWGDDFWVRRMAQTLSRLPSHTLLVIPDVRFDSEAKWIRSQGGAVVQVRRPGYFHNPSHASERGLAQSNVDYVIDNDGTVQDLAADADRFIERFIESREAEQ